MDAIISFANAVFKPLIDLGAAPMMTIFITLVSVLLGVKFSKALEGGIKLGIAIAGISAVISVLSGALSSALTQFGRRSQQSPGDLRTPSISCWFS